MHGYMLVFRDGISHTLILEKEYALPPAHYKHSVIANTLTSHDFRFPIRMFKNAVYELPEEKVALDSLSSCSKVPSIAQTRIADFKGVGATYLVHLLENRVLRISTPGGLATASSRLDNSSTWELDARQLGEFKLELVENQLRIGTVIVHLPEYGAEDLIDQIFVIGPRGVVHTVDLSFDTIYVSGLDARYFEPPSTSDTDLPEAFSAVAQSELDVSHIAMSDGTRGRLKYSLPNRKWILDSNKSRAIDMAQLTVYGRCEHDPLLPPKPELPDN
jgi:hypothetical protein